MIATNTYISAHMNRNKEFLRLIMVTTSLVSDCLPSAVPGYSAFRNKTHDSLLTFVALFSFYFYDSGRACLCLRHGVARSFTANEKALLKGVSVHSHFKK